MIPSTESEKEIEISPSFKILHQGMTLYRIFDPSKRGDNSTTFRMFGPVDQGRFDHHRGFGVSREASYDDNRGILYVGPLFESCILEVYKDKGVIDISNEVLAIIEIVRDLILLDLTQLENRENAGTFCEINSSLNRSLTQYWSRCFYDTQTYYKNIDGIIHLNRHNSKETVSLYERASDALKESSSLRLDHEDIRDSLLYIGMLHNLPVEIFK